MVCLLYKRGRARPFIYINRFVIEMSLFAGYCVNLFFCCTFESWKTYLTITTIFSLRVSSLAYFHFLSLPALLLVLTV